MRTRTVWLSFIVRISFIACLAAIVATALPIRLPAQTAPATPQTVPAASSFEFHMHFIGEPVKRFFRLEREARDEVEVCHENPNRPACGRLLDAVEDNKRAEISTSAPVDSDHPEGDRETTDWVLDGGKLVKISMLVNDAPESLKTLGRPTSEKSIPSQNAAGAKWENHVTIWQSPDLYVALYLDNNPRLTDHRLSLTIETPAEHTRENPDANSSTSPSQPAPAPNSK